jgi:hypothetical protein
MAALLAVFAGVERETAGTGASRNGKKLGWPAAAATKAGEVRLLCRAGIGKAEIARRLQLGRTLGEPDPSVNDSKKR